MSEKEIEFIENLQHYIAKLKKIIMGISSTLLIAIVTGTLIVWQAAIVNAEKLTNVENRINRQEVELAEKADTKVLFELKKTLEQEIITNMNAIEGQLKIVISMLPYSNTTNNYQKGSSSVTNSKN